MNDYRLDLEYEGTRYSGWQIQENARTVAGELQRAIGATGAKVVTLGGAGRTDAGVHALHQVAHLRLERAMDVERLRLAINDGLPPDIHVLGIWRTTGPFHARHDAAARSYLYQISRRRSALAKRYLWWIKRPLDVGRMREAAALLPGRHDFRLLCEAPSKQQTTVVVVDRAEIVECGDLILVRLLASHFLWKMVRRVVGTLVRVGAGETDLATWRDLIDADPETPAGPSPAAAWTAPPSGLFLERVLYPGDPPLAPPAPVTPLARERGEGSVPFLGRGQGATAARQDPAPPRGRRRA